MSPVDPRRLWEKVCSHIGTTVEHPLSPATRDLKARIHDPGVKKTVSVCPYCAVGCSTLVYHREGRVIDIEGNPDSPVNAGTLCPKGSANFGLHVSPYRQTRVKYRRPYSGEWEELPLERAMYMIAERTKKTRDENWQDTDDQGRKLNRLQAVSSIGGAAIDNEENYLITKLFHSMGFTRITNQYPTEEPYDEPEIESILKEISGYRTDTGEPVGGFAELEADGSTACGGWIYSGVYAGGVNHARDRKPASEQDLVASGWGWAWPDNRRILYNRASADPEGGPWSERKKYVWWDEEQQRWTGHDVPDFQAEKPPSYQPEPDAKGVEALPGNGPFILNGDGRGWLFAPVGLKDGPLPVHYEAVESPVPNLLYYQQKDPAVRVFYRPDNPYNPPEDPRYPYVVTTYRLTEHHTSGAMTRWIPWLGELQPELFCEISPELAAEKGVGNAGWVTITTSRGSIHTRALVSERIPVYRFDGRNIHTIGLPYHWGPNGVVSGDVVNDILPVALEANVAIHEAKAFSSRRSGAVQRKGDSEWLPAS